MVEHIASRLSPDLEIEKKRLERLGVAVTTREHAWVHWCSLYVNDPQGHEVEFVCSDTKVP